MTRSLLDPVSLAANSGLFLLVHNDGESSVKLNVTLLPVNSSQNDVDILAHKVRKVCILSNPSNFWISLIRYSFSA